MTRKQKIIILFFISIPVFLVGYFLVCKQIANQPSPANKIAIQEKSPHIKIKETEKEVLPQKEEIEIIGIKPEIDDGSLSIKTSESFYAFPYGLPHEFYLKHINLAEDGIPESQYYVYQALGECRGAPLTYGDLIKRQEKFPQFSLNIEKSFKKCEKFTALLNANKLYSNRSFSELANMWREISFENEYPLAISDKMMFNNTNSYSVDEKRTALQNSIKLGRYEGYNHVIFYYLLQSIRSKDKSRITNRAWMALTCDKNPACLISEHLKSHKMKLTPTDYRKMKETFESIKDSIERKAWHELEIFEEPSPN